MSWGVEECGFPAEFLQRRGAGSACFQAFGGQMHLQLISMLSSPSRASVTTHFFPPFIIPPLLAAVWQCSASRLSDSCVCLFASLQRRIPQLFTRGPQLCWSSSSSSTNHLIPDSITAVHTAPRSSCEAPSSCCFASLLLHKAPAGSRGTWA